MQRIVRRDMADLRDWHNDSGISGLQGALADRATDADPDAFYVMQFGSFAQRVPATLQLPAGLLEKKGWHDFTLPDSGRPALAKRGILSRW
ncbi:MAG: hypothetical protein QM756_41850 [Polyangiaceae bacterium]